MPKPVVFCPLAYERRAIARKLRDLAVVITIGPGADAVREAINQVKSQRPPLLVLFGLAGGLKDDVLAPRISRVMDKDAHSWSTPVMPPGDDPPVTMVGVDEPVTHPARKRQMGTAYGAAIVDCESHAFAKAAEEANLRWAIIRGVSDGPDDHLPTSASDWVDDKGKTRLLKVIGSIILNPSLIFTVLKLGRRSRPALRAASARLIELIRIEAAQMQDPLKHTAPHTQDKHAPRTGAALPDKAVPNPIERQLGRKSARLNDPPKASKPTSG